MSKRKAEDYVDTTYAIIETVEGDAEVIVQYIPRIWLKEISKNRTIKLRESAKYYYPKRSENQSVDQHLKFVKRAKFECTKPNKKWDLLDCRVLKIGLGSIIDAMNAEKLFSDFFNTTDAEAEIQKQQVCVSSAKRLRKTRKTAVNKCLSESESDNEIQDVRKSTKNATISSYNALFQSETIPNYASLGPEFDKLDLEELNENFDLSLDIMEQARQMNLTEKDLTFNDGNLNNYSQNACNASENQISNDERQTDADSPAGATKQGSDVFQDIVIEYADENDNSGKNTCKCLQKVLNKIDYVQKKMLKEVGRYRQETSQAIRQLSYRFDAILKSQAIEESAEDFPNDDFEAKYDDIFPVKSAKILIEINNTIKSDREFKKRLISKLKLKKKEDDDKKAARQILKSLCGVACISEFTWTGTGATKRSNFSALESFIGVITEVIEEQFPGCDAFETIKKVVQQRTKSAPESVSTMAKQLATKNGAVLAENREIQLNNSPGQQLSTENVTATTESQDQQPNLTDVDHPDPVSKSVSKGNVSNAQLVKVDEILGNSANK